MLKSVYISLVRLNGNDFPLFKIRLYFSKVGLKNENFLAVFVHMTVDSRSETLHRFMSLAIAVADYKLINSTQSETDILDNITIIIDVIVRDNSTRYRRVWACWCYEGLNP